VKAFLPLLKHLFDALCHVPQKDVNKASLVALPKQAYLPAARHEIAFLTRRPKTGVNNFLKSLLLIYIGWSVKSNHPVSNQVCG
jgi:hypothetical protein